MEKIQKTKILFVCLGNICRSPSAHTIFQKMVNEKGLSDRFEIDSAGIIGHHAGEMADPRMRKYAANRDYNITTTSRQLKKSDFEKFDMIIGMDNRNIADLRKIAYLDENISKISKMTDYCEHFKEDEVPDPYYSGYEGFEYVLDLLEDACASLLTKLNDV